MKLFYGTECSGADIKMGNGFVPYILISAGTLWNGKKFRNYHPSMRSELFLDSGGFMLFQKFGDYPFECMDFVLLARKLGADYVATMDYPCEPQVLREGNLKTNRERIDATIKNTIKCLETDPELNWIPVIQGYYLKEYIYCMDRYEELGVKRGKWAVGTLCARSDLRSTLMILRCIRERHPNGWLHGFGLDLSFLKNRWIRERIDSADTQAWKFGHYKKGRMPDNQADKLKHFLLYQKKVAKLLNPDLPKPLTEFK